MVESYQKALCYLLGRDPDSGEILEGKFILRSMAHAVFELMGRTKEGELIKDSDRLQKVIDAIYLREGLDRTDDVKKTFGFFKDGWSYIKSEYKKRFWDLIMLGLTIALYFFLKWVIIYTGTALGFIKDSSLESQRIEQQAQDQRQQLMDALVKNRKLSREEADQILAQQSQFPDKGKK